MLDFLKGFFRFYLFVCCLASFGMLSKDESGSEEEDGRIRSSSSGSDSSTDSVPCESSFMETIRGKMAEIKPEELFKNGGSLYLLAFNVGQANFMLLKKGADLCIIDAGGKLEDIERRFLDGFFKENKVKCVFVTHPHSDHFSLFCGPGNLLATYSTSFSDCKFFLSGSEEDWSVFGDRQAFIDTIPKEKLSFLQGYERLDLPSSPFDLNLLDVIPIKSHLSSESTSSEVATSSVSPGKENQLSLIIQASFAGKTILFTGDAEGEVFGRLFRRSVSLRPFKWLYPTQRETIETQMSTLKSIIGIPGGSLTSAQTTEYWRLYDELATGCNMRKSSDLYASFAKENGWNTPESISEEAKKGKLMEHFIHILRIRQAFRSSDVIILPHHGTTTEASQNFLGYFSPYASSHSKLFIVSSSPFGASGLPKASVLEMAPRYPRIFEHPFLYCRDGLPKIPVQFTTTSKPILLTGAAPAGFQAVQIASNGKIFVLDPTNATTPWQEFDTKPGSEETDEDDMNDDD